MSQGFDVHVCAKCGKKSVEGHAVTCQYFKDELGERVVKLERRLDEVDKMLEVLQTVAVRPRRRRTTHS